MRRSYWLVLISAVAVITALAATSHARQAEVYLAGNHLGPVTTIKGVEHVSLLRLNQVTGAKIGVYNKTGILRYQKRKLAIRAVQVDGQWLAPLEPVARVLGYGVQRDEVRRWITLVKGAEVVKMVNPVKIVNGDNPGEEIDIAKLVEPGKVNIFDFYSEYCGPCVRIAPVLEELAKRNPQVVVHKVDINRKGVVGIDWASPLVKQYKIDSVPHFKIWDADGKKFEGDAAREQLMDLFKAAKID